NISRLLFPALRASLSYLPENEEPCQAGAGAGARELTPSDSGDWGKLPGQLASASARYKDDSGVIYRLILDV
ncbi:hypothetical protein LB507_001834, partial [Fusarium sp. FIESC RH6]